MPLCTVNKWGCGTTTEKVPDTDASKAMKERLAATLVERARQDALWQAPSAPAPAEAGAKAEAKAKKELAKRLG